MRFNRKQRLLFILTTLIILSIYSSFADNVSVYLRQNMDEFGPDDQWYGMCGMMKGNYFLENLTVDLNFVCQDEFCVCNVYNSTCNTASTEIQTQIVNVSINSSVSRTVFFNASLIKLTSGNKYHFSCGRGDGGAPFTQVSDNDNTTLPVNRPEFTWECGQVRSRTVHNRLNICEPTSVRAVQVLGLNNASVVDTTPPLVSLLSPANGITALSNNNPLAFKASATDANAITQCGLYHNSSGSFILEKSNTTIISGVEFSFSSTVARTHIGWNVQCTDANLNSAFAASNFTLTILDTHPTFNNLQPPDNFHDRKNFSVNFTYTDFDNDVGQCSLFINNSLQTTATNIASGSVVIFSTNVTSGDGHYGWNVSCSNNFGANNTQRLFVLDTINPIITFVNPSPANTTISRKDLALDITCVNANLFQFNVTVVNSLGSDVFFKPRNTTGTQLSITDIVSLSIEGNYTVIAKCSDQVNSAETHVKYQLELTAPTFTQNATNGSDSTRRGEDVRFTVNWTDEHPAQFRFCFGEGVNCVNETPQTYTSGQLMTVAKTITAVHNQQVNWLFYANDSVGNVNFTPLSFFTVANTPPTAPSISYTAPPMAFSDSFLNCSAFGSTDADNELITFFYQFRDNDDSTVLQAFSANNSFNCNNPGCNQGDTIFCHAKANDGFNDSAEGNTASIFINNAAPTHGLPLLMGGSNFTNETLVCANVSTFDADNDPVKNIFNWHVDGKSILELNMPFEGIPGANTRDYSPHNNNGTEHGGIVWNSSAGFDGKGAYDFDGVNDFINLSKPSSLINLNTSLSVEAWVFSDNNAGQHLIVDNCENFATEGYCLLLVDNEFRFHVGRPGAPKAVATGIQTGRWYHLVGTYDNITAKMYVDGSLINSTAAAGPLQKAGDEEIVIGFNSPANANYFDGRIDDLRVWNRALSADQVLNLFNNKSNQFAAAETVRLQSYLCFITPNDGFADGLSKNSSSLTVLNAVPAAVSLLSPADGFSAGVLPEFNWTASSDFDPEDSVRYIIQVDNNSNFGSLEYTNTSSAHKDGNVTLDRTRINTYFWRVFATDGIGNSTASNVHNFTYAKWGIMFNVTGSDQDMPELNFVNISNCNFTGFSQGGDTSNLYGPFDFLPRDFQCTFSVDFYFDKIQTFTVDNDKLVNVIMPQAGGLTFQEHTWLEAIYNCAILKQCDLYNLLLQINQTVGNVWEHTKPTDKSVITSETITNKIVNTTHNLTIDYTVNIPIKAGYNLGAYLPVRIGFWFLNTANTTCHNQGDRPKGVANPYCQPLMVETIGPMGGSVSFTAKLQPILPAGDYSIKRIIDIDPQGVWINYGQEEIDTIEVTEDITSFGSSLERTGETMPSASSPGQPSAGGGGGGGSSGGNDVTNIYQNITQVIIQQGESRLEPVEEVVGDEEISIKDELGQKINSGLEGITTAAAVGNIGGNITVVGVLGLICLIFAVLTGYFYRKSKNK